MINSNKRSNALADRLLEGANKLANYTKGLSETDWKTPVAGDGRTVGVVVHHVASVYPLEVELAEVLALGNPITEATKDGIDQMNAEHAKKYADVDKAGTLELLINNSEKAAEKVRSITDEELENSATVSLNANAPLTAQFFIEDHALRHSFHHLARIQATLEG